MSTPEESSANMLEQLRSLSHRMSNALEVIMQAQYLLQQSRTSGNVPGEDKVDNHDRQRSHRSRRNQSRTPRHHTHPQRNASRQRREHQNRRPALAQSKQKKCEPSSLTTPVRASRKVRI